MRAAGGTCLREAAGGCPTQAAGDASHRAAVGADGHPGTAWEMPGLPRERMSRRISWLLHQGVGSWGTGGLSKKTVETPNTAATASSSIRLVLSGCSSRYGRAGCSKQDLSFRSELVSLPLLYSRGTWKTWTFGRCPPGLDRTQHTGRGKLCLDTSALSCPGFSF